MPQPPPPPLRRTAAALTAPPLLIPRVSWLLNHLLHMCQPLSLSPHGSQPPLCLLLVSFDFILVEFLSTLFHKFDLLTMSVFYRVLNETGLFGQMTESGVWKHTKSTWNISSNKSIFSNKKKKEAFKDHLSHTKGPKSQN